jgi:oligo-1,6-glucosidase
MLQYNHGPHIHEYLEEFKRDVFDHYDCFTLAEAPLVWPKQALKYIDEEQGQIDMMIQFQCQCADCLFTDYLPTRFSLRRMKRAFSSWQKKLEGKAWNMLYIENHDHPRIISRYGSEKFWKESGKTLAAMYLFQQGTPFLYQGQEIGMLNWQPEDAEMYEDVQTRYTYAHSNLNKSPEVRLKKMWRSSRDSARTPVQWDSSENAGFTTGKPWFYVNQNYTEINAAAQTGDPDSVFSFYKELIRLRHEMEVIVYGSYDLLLPEDENLYVYTRTYGDEKLLIVCNFSEKEQAFAVPEEFAGAEKLIGNYEGLEDGGRIIRPYEAYSLHIK